MAFILKYISEITDLQMSNDFRFTAISRSSYLDNFLFNEVSGFHVINHKVICRLRKIEQLLRHPLKIMC